MPKGMKPRRPSSPINIWALILGALLFMGAPALLAFAGADVPETERSKAAIARQHASLSDALSAQGFAIGQPVYLQITKAPARLTAFIAGDDGTYEAFRSWPICAYSGGLGPKRAEGDGMSPEGFYAVPASAMNPASNYHLSFNLGYPNTFDRANGRTGSYLMVHGACVSIGCYAMTDAGIEEIWTLMAAAFEGGQQEVPVHVFPFPMTAANLQAHAGHPDAAFWRSLAPAWALFETTGQVPETRVVGGRYTLAGGQ